MAGQVRELEGMQQQIRRYRPWFDESLRTLTILRQLTEAFPDDGSVSAKTLEVREPGLVTCSGVARDYRSLQRMEDKLRGNPHVADMKVGTLRGRSPMQFTFDFRWGEGARNEH
jgi:Tfp pilus assembly protein PilN